MKVENQDIEVMIIKFCQFSFQIWNPLAGIKLYEKLLLEYKELT